MFVSGPFGSKEFEGLFSLWLEMYLATFVPGFNRVRQEKTAEAGSFPHMSQALAMAATFTEIQRCHLEAEVGVAQPTLHETLPLVA